MNEILHSFAIGYACLSASADLLDQINVFPVADGDTGTNLRISLAPLRSPGQDGDTMRLLLARCATGNSGNIAAAFFREFCQAQNRNDLAEAAALGREKAWQAIARPFPGTMLTVFDSLASILASHTTISTVYSPLSLELQKSVGETTRRLPILSQAGVVDSGALAMYVFFDGFFRHLTQHHESAGSIFDLFSGKLAISGSFQPEISNSYCVDAVIQLPNRSTTSDEPNEQAQLIDDFAGLGESVVVVQNDSSLKLHIHTADPGRLRGQLDSFGNIVRWSDEAMNQPERLLSAATAKPPLHIVTDAAGSLTREMARQSGLTLLDSYIITGDDSRPESLCNSEEIYRILRKGGKVTTAQASTFERYQHYQNISRQFGPSLYLCVGAAFTGNYDAAISWKMKNDIEDRFTVLDTGAASGKLALIALLTCRYAEKFDCDGKAIIAFAENLIEECQEYVFIHELKYLVAGGRLSKAGGFFGDLLHMKPVITPTRNGVQKAGVVRSTRQQLIFALEKLKEQYDSSTAPTIMLQYSDNHDWVAEVARQQVRALLPEAEILLTPLSLTSGIHMGPGTWSVAFASPCPAGKHGADHHNSCRQRL